MMEWIIAALAGIVAWILRSIIADRTKTRLEQERNEALDEAKAQKIRAEAKDRETALRGEQQKHEDALHAADHDTIVDRLDGMFR